VTPIKAPGDLSAIRMGLSVLFATETWERFSYFVSFWQQRAGRPLYAGRPL
jgi:hypothetical protein